MTEQLKNLWQLAFGDSMEFIDLFFRTAYSSDRCLYLTEDDEITAALYWLDCGYQEQKQAYIYAVATHPDHRGKGLCRRLLKDVHKHLVETGYESAMLVPETESLRQMYRKLGYEDCTTVSEFSCTAGDSPMLLRAIGPAEYAALRRELLPGNSVLQEGENLTFLAQQAQFFAGDRLLLTAWQDEDTLHAMEFLGDRSIAPAILRTLNCTQGHFRTPGTGKPFAMFHPLTAAATKPDYFGFAFD
jgi:ribosomal protein S18 acetylase RimI-like enzyme